MQTLPARLNDFAGGNKFSHNQMMLNKTWFPKKDILVFFVFYFIAHGGILFLGNSVFWDDWVLVGASFENISTEFSEAGSFLNISTYILAPLNTLGAFAYKILTFILMFFTGVLFYKLLIRDVKLKQNQAFIIAMLYLISPLFIARVALIDFGYILSVFLFFAGWWYFFEKRIISLLLFFVSFFTQSLMVFYCIPIFFTMNILNKNKNYFSVIKNRIDFLLLPFIWFYLKLTFYKPYGNYAGYNEHYNIKNLFNSPYAQWLDFKSYLATNQVTSKIFFIVFFILICILMLGKFKIVMKDSKPIKLIFYGILAFLLGVFPYWILGHVPSFWEWTSRHQLLMSFGLSIMIVGIIGSLSFYFQQIALTSIVSICLIINWTNYQDFYNDSIKQKELVSFLKESKEVQNSSLIIFDDKSANAIFRSYRFYEWNGLLHTAYPEDFSKFGINLAELNSYDSGSYDTQFKRFHTTINHQRTNAAVMVKLERIDGKNIFILNSYR